MKGGPYRKQGRELDKRDKKPNVDDLIDRLEKLYWTRDGNKATSHGKDSGFFQIDNDGWLWFDNKRIETDRVQQARLKKIYESTHDELLTEAYKAAR